MSPIVILGCGPSGLLAAEAIRRQGNEEIVIISKKRPSRLYGCQYLHAPIPGINDDQPGTLVRYALLGTADKYAEKVYGGDAHHVKTSVEVLEKEHYAWDLRAAYDYLYARWEASILDHVIEGPDEVADILAYYRKPLCFSTIPAQTLCHQPTAHTFSSQPVWAVGDAPEEDRWAPYRPEAFTVVCNAKEAPRWYRAANVFDYCTVEWPHHPRPPQEGLAEVHKPLGTNCNCFEHVIRLGRYGKWQKGVLTHHAFQDASRVIRNGVQQVMF